MSEKNNGSGRDHAELTLSAPDAAILDALLGRERPTEGSPAEVNRAREQRVQEWLKVLAAAPVPEPSSDLLQRTLAGVQRDRMRLPATAAEIDMTPHVRRRWSRRVAELGAMAVAASILLALVIVGLQQAKQSNARIACAQNMTALASGMGAYAADNGSQLPMLAMPADHNWMRSSDSGAAYTNASNLLPLITGKYITLANLQCAGVTQRRAPTRLDDVVSDYSYTHVYNTSALRPRWNKSRDVVVLADRNPLFVAQTLPTSVTLDETNRNSPNHNNKGNYVLRAGGTFDWVTTPNVGGDNIWTVEKSGQRVLAYSGIEAPSAAGDTFLCP